MTTRFCLILFLIIGFCFCLVHSSVSDYLSSFFSPKRYDYNDDNGIDALPMIPYELNEKDERFLKEAEKYIGPVLSKLDLCHQRVIITLTESCHKLDSESLGKLAVMLLNCQSDTEGRMIYECTAEMTLKECTSRMDSDTWTAYHLMTNRAKAICTTVRQDQFRGLTEMTVNKLMKSAHDQIYMMDKLTENQEKLKSSTADAIDKLAVNNRRIIEQQEDILTLTDEHRSTVESSLKNIQIEKGLIKSGQIEVANIISDLKQRLEDGMNSLKIQFGQTKVNHAELLKDLNELYGSAVKISEKLTEATELILSQTELTGGQFDLTMKQLNDINKTIYNLSNLLEQVQNGVNEKLNWILTRMGGTDSFISTINIVIIHLAYLLLGMLLIVFLNAPLFHRIFFITALAVNFCAVLFGFFHMDMLLFTSVLFSVFIGHFIRTMLSGKKVDQMLTIEKKLDNTTKPITSSNDETDTVKNEQIGSKSIERESHIDRWLNNNYERSRSGTPYSSSLSDRMRCAATTVKGVQCRNATHDDLLYCSRHRSINNLSTFRTPGKL